VVSGFPSTDSKAAGSSPGCPAACDVGGDVPGVLPGDEVGGHRAAAAHVLDLRADDARHRAPAEALAERGAECLVEVGGERAGRARAVEPVALRAPALAGEQALAVREIGRALAASGGDQREGGAENGRRMERTRYALRD